MFKQQRRKFTKKESDIVIEFAEFIENLSPSKQETALSVLSQNINDDVIVKFINGIELMSYVTLSVKRLTKEKLKTKKIK